mmetsp:Transcript_5672/g.22947  ORF Transcript_5672/g.22947 Transcript_5672/m.22947 type:complete len:369 (-) Transcript_5672:52-1158(-)
MCAELSHARARRRFVFDPVSPTSTRTTAPSEVPSPTLAPSNDADAAETGSRVARIDPTMVQDTSSGLLTSGVHRDTKPSPLTLRTVTTSPSARNAARRYDATTRFAFFPVFPRGTETAGSRKANSLLFFSTLQSAAPAFSGTAADSADVVSTLLSSGEKHTHVTASACAPTSLVNVMPPARSSLSAHSQMHTRPSSSPTASFAPSDENAAHFTSQSATVDRAAEPSAARRAGLTTYGDVPAPARLWLAGGSAFSSSPSASSSAVAGSRVTSYTATSPPKTHSTRELSGNITSACGAVSSVWQEKSGSDSVSPSNVATQTRLGMPLDFFPPPPATSRERSSAQAEAYRGMPNFFVFGLGFFGAMAAGES